jgi:hypothetical protein
MVQEPEDNSRKSEIHSGGVSRPTLRVAHRTPRVDRIQAEIEEANRDTVGKTRSVDRYGRTRRVDR